MADDEFTLTVTRDDMPFVLAALGAAERVCRDAGDHTNARRMVALRHDLCTQTGIRDVPTLHKPGHA